MFFPLCGNIVCDIKYKDYFKNTLVHKQISYRAIFKIANFSLRVPFEPSPALYLQHQCICGNLGWTSTVASWKSMFPLMCLSERQFMSFGWWNRQLYIKLAILTTVENRFHFLFLHFVIIIWDCRGFYLIQNIKKCPHL